jgi:hypothetical protein
MRDFRITSGIADDGMEPPEMGVRDAWLTFGLDLERLTLAERLMPAEGDGWNRVGVYFHVLDGVLEYIGQATNIGYRRSQHIKNGRQWDAEWWLLLPEWWPGAHVDTWLDAVEYATIRHCKPMLNRRRVMAVWDEVITAHIRAAGFAVPGSGKTRDPYKYTPLRMPGRLPHID